MDHHTKAGDEDVTRGEHAPHARHEDHARTDAHAGHAEPGGHDAHAGHSVEMFRRKLLISLALAVAFVFSLAVTLGYPGMPLWEELATLVTVMLLGHWIEMKSIARAQGALKELAKLLPDTATRITDG